MKASQFTSAFVRAARTHAVVLLAVCAAACTSVTPTQRPVGDAAGLESRARAAEEAGDFATAADLYTRLATASSGTTRVEYLLQAARLAVDYGDTALARRRVAEARSGASAAQQQAMTVVSARIDLAEGRPQAALDLLATLPQAVPEQLQRDASTVRGQALFRVGRPVEAVRVLVEREVWLTDAASVLANQRMIWDGFRASPTAAPAPNTGDPVVDGWLALAPLTAATGDELRRSLLAWRQTYTTHPAAAGLLSDLLAAQRSTAFPSRIALLLPLSSPQRAFALAIRDGFMAAHLRNPANAATSVRVYDSARLGSTQAYQQAQLDGADFIVGPLSRGAVDEVMEQAGFVPTLALNYATRDATLLRGFYQFALAPEDEARTIAAAAIAAGARTAVAFVPSDQRGYEIRDSFKAAFEQAGGVLLDWYGYEPALRDFSAPTAALLNVNRSRERHRRLAATLGVNVQFPEPRRREDVDMIFVVAFEPTPARLLASQLKFFGAGDIPVYATSLVYDANNQGRDNDLNGFIFADTPALLTPDADTSTLLASAQSFWSQTRDPRFYGMGYDAYELIGPLYSNDGTGWTLRGMSGDLSLDPQGRVRRVLPLAQFRNGRPVALDNSLLAPIDTRSLTGRR